MVSNPAPSIYMTRTHYAHSHTQLQTSVRGGLLWWLVAISHGLWRCMEFAWTWSMWEPTTPIQLPYPRSYQMFPNVSSFQMFPDFPDPDFPIFPNISLIALKPSSGKNSASCWTAWHIACCTSFSHVHGHSFLMETIWDCMMRYEK